VAVVGHAARHVADGIAVVEDDGEKLPRIHRFQLQLRLDEVVRADDSAQVQFVVHRVIG
jgi:hypothetical protein